MEQVLNVELYTRLMNAFDNNVKISNQGIPFVGRILHDKVTGYKKIEVQQAGEYYCVCCPVCGDTRNRLWINHRWNSELTQGHFTMKLSRLRVCYNEGCQDKPEFYPMLTKMLNTHGAFKPTRITVDENAKPLPLKPLEMAGKFIRIDKLPRQHAAVRYIEEVRGMSAEDLGVNWDVVWFEYSPVLPPMNRLFFPFYDLDEHGDKILVGGQAHWLDVYTLNGTPPKEDKSAVKWHTMSGTRKSQHLFNGWRARKQDKLVVVVEGPFDCATLGKEFSVSLFGHTASLKHKQLLWDTWGVKKAMGVLALDPDVAHEPAVIDLEHWFKSWANHRILRVPDNKDIGDFSRDDAWTLIAQTGALDNI